MSIITPNHGQGIHHISSGNGVNFKPDHQEVRKCGTLTKRSQGKSLFGRQNPNWKVRYFVLTDRDFSYWDNMGSGQCKGSIPIGKITAVEKVDDSAFFKENMLQIIHTSILYVQCKSAEEREEWVQALRDQCADNAFMHLTYHPGHFDFKLGRWTCCEIPSEQMKGCHPAYNYRALEV